MRHKKSILLLALATLVVLCGAILMKNRGSSEGALVGLPESAAADTGSSRLSASHAATTARVAAGEHVLDSSSPPESTHGLEPRLGGVIVVQDLKGSPILVRKGYILWRPVSAPSSAKPIRCSVKLGGYWEFPVPTAEGEYELLRAVVSSTLGGTSAIRDFQAFSIEARVDLRHSRPNEVHCCLGQGVTLNIVDARTKAHLSGALVHLVHKTREAYGAAYCAPPHAFVPDDNKLRGDSPLILPVMRGVITGWARADGYAWSRFAFDAESSTVLVELRQGADLHVKVKGVPPGSAGAFATAVAYRKQKTVSVQHAVPANTPLASRILDDAGGADFYGLPSGEVVVAIVQNQQRGYIGPRLGQGQIDLLPGADALLTIDLNALNSRLGLGTIQVKIARTALSQARNSNNMLCIELRGGAEIGDGAGPVILHPLSTEMNPGDGFINIETVGLPPGAYHVSIIPSGVAHEIALAPGETVEVDFEATQMAEVELTLFRPDGQRLGTSRVEARHGTSSSGVAWTIVGGTDASGFIRFNRPVGIVDIVTTGASYPTMFEFELHAGLNKIEATVDAAPKFTVAVTVTREGNEVLLPHSFWRAIKVTPLSEGARPLARCQLLGAQIGGLLPISGRGAILHFITVGSYRLDFPNAPGIPAFSPHQVEVGSDGPGECVVAW